jgi:hypothetical protein
MHPTAASDNGAAVVDDQLFRFLVGSEVKKARRLRYCVSVVYLTADVPPVTPQEPAERALAELVTPCIRDTDAVTSWAPASLALLLIDADATQLPTVLRRVTARLGTRAWSAGGACYPTTASRADDLLHQAMDSMVQAKEDGGNRLYVEA